MKPSIEQLVKAIQNSWSAETSYDASDWSAQNPARGHCVVSSLIIQKYLGGDLRRYRVSGSDFDETHYCNILTDGTLLDVTASQYKSPVSFTATPINLKGFASIRDKRLADRETRLRYELLLERVKSYLE